MLRVLGRFQVAYNVCPQLRKHIVTTMGSCVSKDGSYDLAKSSQGQGSGGEGPVSVTMTTVEAVVCNADDLKDGEMREVEVGGHTALLVRDAGQFHAIGPKCSHYGAPLSKGVLCNGRVRCPWHGACFNIKTGDIEEFPGLDSVPTFDVSVADGKVMVKGSKSALENTKRQKHMASHDSSNQDTYLLVGGGPATVACAETLRQEGFTGHIILATRESHLPYDRPKLSKALDSKPEAIALRPADFYKSHDIDLQTNKEVVSVDIGNKSVSFLDGSSQKYTKLMLGTGANPRSIPVPGVNLKNVCMLRTPDDANYIAEQARGKNVVVVGASFIGMEVAAFLADKAASVSVVDMVSTPFELALGADVGRIVLKLFEAAGVKFYGSSGIKEFTEGASGLVDGVIVKDGTKLPADIVVMGTGVGAATQFLKNSGLDMNRFGHVLVDKLMKTSADDVYAAGDIVEFPLSCLGDQKVNIGHWQVAHSHGRTAALNMLGKNEPNHSVPYFWTQMFGKSLRYTGYGPGFDDVSLHGDVDEGKFVAFYTKGDNVVAAASMFFDPIVSQIAEHFAAGKTITKDQIKTDPRGWMK